MKALIIPIAAVAAAMIPGSALAQAAGDEKGLALPLADLVEGGLETLLAGEGEMPDLAALAEVSRGRVEGR